MKKIVKIIILLLFVFGFTSCSETYYKKIIIEHQHEIIKDRNNYFTIENVDLGYYDHVTIRKNSDSTLFIVFWGDRNSWLWRFKLDNYFSIDIPYKRYKNKDVDVDIQIVNILNEKNKNYESKK